MKQNPETHLHIFQLGRAFGAIMITIGGSSYLFFDSETFGALLAVIGSVIVAISVYGVWYNNKLIEKEKKRKSRSQFLNDFLFELESLNKPLDAQIKNVQETKRSISENKKSIGIGVIQNLMGLDTKFQAFPKKRLYSELINLGMEENEVRKLIENILVNVRFVKTIVDQIKEMPNMVNNINDNKRLITSSIQEIQKLQIGYASEIEAEKISLDEDQYLRGFFAIYNDHLKVAHEFKFLFGKHSLIDPLKNLVNRFLTTDERARELNIILVKCSHSYKLIAEGISGFEERLTDAETKLQEAKGNLNDYLKTITEFYF